MWLKPSFEPIVATTSWSGSRLTLQCQRFVAIGDSLFTKGCKYRLRHCNGGCANRGRPRKACRSPNPREADPVGLPISQVDDVDPIPSFAILELVDLAEKVGREVADPRRDLEVVSFNRLVLLGTWVRRGIDHSRSRFRPTAAFLADEIGRCLSSLFGHSGLPYDRENRARRPKISLTFTLALTASPCIVSRACECSGYDGRQPRSDTFHVISRPVTVDTRSTTRTTHRLGWTSPRSAPRTRVNLDYHKRTGAARFIRTAPDSLTV